MLQNDLEPSAMPADPFGRSFGTPAPPKNTTGTSQTKGGDQENGCVDLLRFLKSNVH